MRVTLNLDLPDALEHELQSAARTSGIPATTWAAQAIESELASRRLPRVHCGSHGPRIGMQESEADAEPEGYRILFPNKEEMELIP